MDLTNISFAVHFVVRIGAVLEMDGTTKQTISSSSMVFLLSTRTFNCDYLLTTIWTNLYEAPPLYMFT